MRIATDGGAMTAGIPERLALALGAVGALIHCTAMGFMGWFAPLGVTVDVPVLRPVQDGVLGHAFILLAFAMIATGLRGRPRWVVGTVAAASLWLYASMYLYYVDWLHTLSIVAWAAVVAWAVWAHRVT
jgi:hypothetical protein